MVKDDLLFEKIWSKHKGLIGDIQSPREKLVILVAGVPGSGKTTLLKELKKSLDCLYIRSDDIRDIINFLYDDNVLANNTELKNRYLEYIFQKYVPDFKNQLIILDMSLDRLSDFLLPFVKRHNYPEFSISLNCSEELLRERLDVREDKYKQVFLKNLYQWISDHEDFNKRYKANIDLNSGNISTKEMVAMILDKLKTIYRYGGSNPGLQDENLLS